jgi:hypothetical protein
MTLLPPASAFPLCSRCRVDQLAQEEARCLETAARARIASADYEQDGSVASMSEPEKEMLLYEAIKQVGRPKCFI